MPITITYFENDRVTVGDATSPWKRLEENGSFQWLRNTIDETLTLSTGSLSRGHTLDGKELDIVSSVVTGDRLLPVDKATYYYYAKPILPTISGGTVTTERFHVGEDPASFVDVPQIIIAPGDTKDIYVVGPRLDGGGGHATNSTIEGHHFTASFDGTAVAYESVEGATLASANSNPDYLTTSFEDLTVDPTLTLDITRIANLFDLQVTSGYNLFEESGQSMFADMTHDFNGNVFRVAKGNEAAFEISETGFDSEFNTPDGLSRIANSTTGVDLTFVDTDLRINNFAGAQRMVATSGGQIGPLSTNPENKEIPSWKHQNLVIIEDVIDFTATDPQANSTSGADLTANLLNAGRVWWNTGTGDTANTGEAVTPGFYTLISDPDGLTLSGFLWLQNDEPVFAYNKADGGYYGLENDELVMRPKGGNTVVAQQNQIANFASIAVPGGITPGEYLEVAPENAILFSTDGTETVLELRDALGAIGGAVVYWEIGATSSVNRLNAELIPAGTYSVTRGGSSFLTLVQKSVTCVEHIVAITAADWSLSATGVNAGGQSLSFGSAGAVGGVATYTLPVANVGGLHTFSVSFSKGAAGGSVLSASIIARQGGDAIAETLVADVPASPEVFTLDFSPTEDVTIEVRDTSVDGSNRDMSMSAFSVLARCPVTHNPLTLEQSGVFRGYSIENQKLTIPKLLPPIANAAELETILQGKLHGVYENGLKDLSSNRNNNVNELVSTPINDDGSISFVGADSRIAINTDGRDENDNPVPVSIFASVRPSVAQFSVFGGSSTTFIPLASNAAGSDVSRLDGVSGVPFLIDGVSQFENRIAVQSALPTDRFSKIEVPNLPNGASITIGDHQTNNSFSFIGDLAILVVVDPTLNASQRLAVESVMEYGFTEAKAELSVCREETRAGNLANPTQHEFDPFTPTKEICELIFSGDVVSGSAWLQVVRESDNEIVFDGLTDRLFTTKETLRYTVSLLPSESYFVRVGAGGGSNANDLTYTLRSTAAATTAPTYPSKTQCFENIVPLGVVDDRTILGSGGDTPMSLLSGNDGVDVTYVATQDLLIQDFFINIRSTSASDETVEVVVRNADTGQQTTANTVIPANDAFGNNTFALAEPLSVATGETVAFEFNTGTSALTWRNANDTANVFNWAFAGPINNPSMGLTNSVAEKYTVWTFPNKSVQAVREGETTVVDLPNGVPEAWTICTEIAEVGEPAYLVDEQCYDAPAGISFEGGAVEESNGDMQVVGGAVAPASALLRLTNGEEEPIQINTIRIRFGANGFTGNGLLTIGGVTYEETAQEDLNQNYGTIVFSPVADPLVVQPGESFSSQGNWGATIGPFQGPVISGEGSSPPFGVGNQARSSINYTVGTPIVEIQTVRTFSNGVVQASKEGETTFLDVSGGVPDGWTLKIDSDRLLVTQQDINQLAISVYDWQEDVDIRANRFKVTDDPAATVGITEVTIARGTTKSLYLIGPAVTPTGALWGGQFNVGTQIDVTNTDGVFSYEVGTRQFSGSGGQTITSYLDFSFNQLTQTASSVDTVNTDYLFTVPQVAGVPVETLHRTTAYLTALATNVVLSSLGTHHTIDLSQSDLVVADPNGLLNIDDNTIDILEAGYYRIDLIARVSRANIEIGIYIDGQRVVRSNGNVANAGRSLFWEGDLLPGQRIDFDIGTTTGTTEAAYGSFSVRQISLLSVQSPAPQVPVNRTKFKATSPSSPEISVDGRTQINYESPELVLDPISDLSFVDGTKLTIPPGEEGAYLASFEWAASTTEERVILLNGSVVEFNDGDSLGNVPFQMSYMGYLKAGDTLSAGWDAVNSSNFQDLLVALVKLS